MSVQNIFYGALAALFLVGCAGLPQPGQVLTANGNIVIDGLEVEPATPLPTKVKQRSDVIYNALVGDIAAQRGRYVTAERHYANAAHIGHDAGLAELATRAALAGGDYKAAQRRVTYWLKLKPRHAEALQIAVLLAVQKNDINKVMGYLQRLVKVKKVAGKNGYLEAIRMLEHVENPKLRLALGQRITAGHRNDPQAMFALAVLETGSHNFAKAEALVRSVLKRRPNLNEAQMLLIQVLKSRRDFKGARNTLERFLATAPNNKKLRNTYARMLLEQNDLAHAKLQFQRLYRDNSKDGDSLFALGMLALQLDQRDEGRHYLEKLYALGSHQDDAAFYIGQIFEEEARPEDALLWYAKVESNNRFDAQVRAARIYAKRGSVPRAQEILQQIRGQLNRDVSQIDLIEAEILREAGQYTAALKVLTHALKTNPHNHDLLYARALTAAHIGQIEVLEQDLKQIIAKDPNHVEALNALGYTLASETHRYAEALSYVQRAFAIKPDNPAILDSMGWIQYRMGHPKKAVPYLKRALTLLQDPEIAAHLGEVLWKIGDQDQARQIWRDALNKTPSSEYILKMQELYGVRF